MIQIVIFTITLLMIIGLVLRGCNIAITMLLALLVYSIPLLGWEFIEVAIASFNSTMLNTVLSLFLAMVLANLYRNSKASNELVRSFESFGERAASIAVPAVIGLLPMPAGAYVSATMIDPVFSKIGLSSEKKAFLNYWFRHVWVTTWPLYQNIVLATALLGLSYTQIFNKTWIIMVSALVSGVIMFLIIHRDYRKKRNTVKSFNGLVHAWPFILIALLTLIIGIQLYVSLFVTVLLFIIAYRVEKNIIYYSIRKASDPTLIGLIIVSLIFGNSIKTTGLASILVDLLISYGALAVFMIPFMIVVATGFEFTFVALGFPVLQGFLSSSSNYLTLAFLGGFLGAMLSPAHACLVMSSKYFNADLPRVYKYSLPAALITLLTSLVLMLI
ncbi:MAG: DUF401 family protein [Desulfurococcaceae archaeon]